MDEDFMYNDFKSRIYEDQYTLTISQDKDIEKVFRYLDEDPDEIVRIYPMCNEPRFVDTAVFSAVGMACYSFKTTIIFTAVGNEGAITQKIIDVCRMASVRIKKIANNVVTVKDLDGDLVDVCAWPIDHIDGALMVSTVDSSSFNFFSIDYPREYKLRVDALGKIYPTFVFINELVD